MTSLTTVPLSRFPVETQVLNTQIHDHLLSRFDGLVEDDTELGFTGAYCMKIGTGCGFPIPSNISRAISALQIGRAHV